MLTRRQVEEAIVEKYTTGLKHNPRYDRKKARDNDWEDDPSNPEYLDSSFEERREQSPWIVFRASDGHNSIVVPTIVELVDVLVEAGLVEP